MPLEKEDATPAKETADAVTGKFAFEPESLKVSLASVEKPVAKLAGQRWRLVYCAGEWPADIPVQITGHPRVVILPVDYEISAKAGFSANLPAGETPLQVNTTAPDGSLIALRIFPAEGLK